MKNTFLVRTEMLKIEPIGKAVRDHAILRVLVGGDEASMLAVPVISSDGSVIDWYAEGLVTARRLVDLPPEAQAAARQRIAGLGEKLEALAEKSERRGGGENRDTAQMLRDILTLPDERYIFVVDDRPILAAWSCTNVDGGRYRTGYSVPGEAVPPPAQAPVTPPSAQPLPGDAPPFPGGHPRLTAAGVSYQTVGRAWWIWPLWLLFALLVTAIMILLLRACALAPYVGWLGLGNYCEQPRGSELAQLQIAVADLEGRLRGEAANCEPPLPPSPPPDAVAEANDRTSDLQRGELEIALIWNTEDDLDLHVEFNCPQTGPAAIGYRQKGQLICGGMLDADANVSDGVLTMSPTEHVVWVESDSIPPGTMNVIVDYYKDNQGSTPQAPYQVVIQREGEEPQIIEGTLAPKERRVVTTLEN